MEQFGLATTAIISSTSIAIIQATPPEFIKLNYKLRDIADHRGSTPTYKHRVEDILEDVERPILTNFLTEKFQKAKTQFFKVEKENSFPVIAVFRPGPCTYSPQSERILAAMRGLLGDELEISGGKTSTLYPIFRTYHPDSKLSDIQQTGTKNKRYYKLRYLCSQKRNQRRPSSPPQTVGIFFRCHLASTTLGKPSSTLRTG
jgi:hypothetical protein